MDNPDRSQVFKEVRVMLPEEFRTAKDVAASIGQWSDRTVAHALRELVDQGIAIRTTENNRCGYPRHLYRRAV